VSSYTVCTVGNCGSTAWCTAGAKSRGGGNGRLALAIKFPDDNGCRYTIQVDGTAGESVASVGWQCAQYATEEDREACTHT